MKWAWLLMVPWLVLADLPASGSFKLNSYGFGNGGTAGSSSSNYKINGLTGETAGSAGSANYKAGAGENYEKQANVPTATLTNDDRWYNKLRLVIGTEGNPSDALYAVAISQDNFATTQYVKSDFTVGSTLAFSDYLTYASWGSTTGIFIRGLTEGTVYSVKVKAYRGKFTESGYGPTASASTYGALLSFDIDVAPTDTSTNPPFDIDFGELTMNAVKTTSDRIWISLDTNGESGGTVYVSGQNAGLKSVIGSYTIGALTGDLGSQPEGFGAQGVSATQVSQGPLTIAAPYDGTGDNVGITDTLIREIFTTSNPIVDGRGSFVLKAKAKTLTPASDDYREILTVIAAGDF